MIQLTDFVFASAKKADGTKEIHKRAYDRVYFTAAEGDTTEIVEREFEGAKQGDAVRPVGAPKSDVSTLYNQMITYLDTTLDEADRKKGITPLHLVISYVERGYDAARRTAIGAQLRPKVVDMDAALLKLYKNLIVAGVCKDVEAAKAFIAATRSQN
jgi:hypothetical protein